MDIERDTLIVSRRYWSLERCIEDASNYKTKNEWRVASSGAYSSAHKNDWLEECCKHMSLSRRPGGYWTKQRCAERAIQYTTRYEWQSEHLASYKAAYRNGWLDECCSHMVEMLKPKGFWTLERCISSAAKFTTRKNWQLGDQAAYKAAHTREWVDICCGHMAEIFKPNGYWTLERCLAKAACYESRTDWARGHPKTYSSAQRGGWLDQCSAHMAEVIKRNNYWTKEICLKEAMRFDTRTEWKLASPSSHTKAARSGWLDEIAGIAGLPNYSGSTAQRAFADICRSLIAGTDIDLREEVSGLAGLRTKVDMAFYRDGAPFLVVEYQGAYWHSEAVGKDRHYHRNRMIALREKNIRLITVHERDAGNPIIISMIRGALGLVEQKIRASKCVAVIVSNATSRGFYDATHIQGGRISGKDQLNLGLEFDGRLVACMTFVRSSDRHTGSGNYDWCLHRFATISYCRVLGAAGRLFKRFRSMHPSASVVSYCDLQFFDGKTYCAIGFEHVRDNPPDYGWVRGQSILAKHEAQRKFLPDLLGSDFDESLSERENMERSGFSKFWDCGKAVYASLP